MCVSMTTPSGSCFFQEKVYMKLLMHFSKYASESVCGVLLGTTSENRSCNTTTVVVDDCLPLSHYSALPSPMLQVGIQMSQTIAKKQSLAIVGCYIAGQCLDEPKDASWWLVDQVQLYGNTCKLLLVVSIQVMHCLCHTTMLFLLVR